MSVQIEIGKLIDGDEKRDAIHIAVAPVIAAVKLEPGEHIGFVASNQDMVGPVLKNIGIVDPFLQRAVMAGDRFFMFLYPNTITSLKHNWTHPAFIDEQPSVPGASESMVWITSFADPYGFSAQRMIEAATDYLETGSYFCDGGTFEGERVPEEFWTHYERVTGKVVREDDRSSFFTCSC